MAGLTVGFQPVLDAADLWRRSDKDLQKRMRATVNREISPWLQSAIRRASGAAFGQDRKIANSARVRSGANPAVVVAGKAYSGGATTADNDIVRVYEFGGARNWRQTYKSRYKEGGGRDFKVTRRTQRQIPARRENGRMVFPAIAEAGPMLVGAWVGLVGEMYGEAARG